MWLFKVGAKWPLEAVKMWHFVELSMLSIHCIVQTSTVIHVNGEQTPQITECHITIVFKPLKGIFLLPLSRVKTCWPFSPHINPEMTSHYVSKGHMNRRVAMAGVTQHLTAILGATCWCLVQSSVLSLLCWIQLEGCYCTGSTMCLGLQKKKRTN